MIENNLNRVILKENREILSGDAFEHVLEKARFELGKMPIFFHDVLVSAVNAVVDEIKLKFNDENLSITDLAKLLHKTYHEYSGVFNQKNQNYSHNRRLQIDETKGVKFLALLLIESRRRKISPNQLLNEYVEMVKVIRKNKLKKKKKQRTDSRAIANQKGPGTSHD